MNCGKRFRRIALAVSLTMLAAAPALAQQAVVHSYAMPSQPLGAALNQLALSSDRQILVPPDLVRDHTAPALDGQYTLDAALRKLLAESGLTYEVTDTDTVVIKRAPSATKPQSTQARKPPLAEKSASPITLEAVAVTGTRIRGGVTASPTITIGAEQIQNEGFSDLGEVIRSIPQNFSGGQNPGVASGATNGGLANQNITGASALNLRGLGPDATLTLLNGRRLTYDGFVQAVDISAIPLEAVERVEIIPDGASAIYGSDAVGGVVNVILKRDFDGLTVRSRYGNTSNGGLGTREYTATAGALWSSGGLIATYKNASQNPIYAGQRYYTRYINDPSTIYAGSDLNSGLVSAYQMLGGAAKLQMDVLRTNRDNSTSVAYPGFYYRGDIRTSVSQVSPTVAFSLPADWTLTVGGSYGKDQSTTKMYYVAGGDASLQAFNCYCNKSYAYEVEAEGPLFQLDGGEARLAVGAGSRTNEFFSDAYLSGTHRGGEERSQYGYAELSLPVLGPSSEVKGVRRLDFSVAVRAEDYESFGRVVTPKLGLIYAPNGDFTLKGSWGKSFKAPMLLQRFSSRDAYLWRANQLGGSTYPADATVLMSYGGNPGLDPERARTWAASAAFHPEALSGLDTELTWFDIDYSDRVVQPIINRGQTLSNPNYAEFVVYSPTPGQQEALLTAYDGAFYNYAGAVYDPTKVVALAFDQYTNAVRQRIKGLDLSASYRFDLRGSGLVLRGAVTWLDSSQKNSPGQPSFDLAGSIFNPAKVKGRFGAVWTRSGFTVSGFANYVGGVTSKLTALTKKTASFTTFDATVSYDVGGHAGVLSGARFALSAENLFNRDPPFYTPPYPTYVPYDSTNYSAIGRYLSLSVSKHW